jgi:hypothetical protein
LWEKRDGTESKASLKEERKGREILVGKERWDRE